MKNLANVDLLSKNGAEGIVARAIHEKGISIGAKRPFLVTNATGEPIGTFITVHKGGSRDKISNYSTHQITTNSSTLRKDQWLKLDTAIIEASQTRLKGINDLKKYNLVETLENPMGTTILEHQKMSEAFEAILSMDGLTKGQGDRPTFTSSFLPIPIIHSDYQIGARELAASQKDGTPLNTANAARAARVVAEKLENLLFGQTSFSFGKGTIYTYLTFPDRNNVTMSNEWDSSAITNDEIIADILLMKQSAINAKHYGKFVLYIPKNYETLMDKDYKAEGDKSLYTRIMDIRGIDGIEVIDELADDNVLLVEMKKETVRLIEGMGIQNVQWDAEGGMVTNYKVMTIQVPEIRSDDNGNSGIVHLSK